MLLQPVLFIKKAILYESPQDARDSARLLLLHEGIQDLPSAAVGRQRALGFVHFLSHFPHNFLVLSV